MSTPSATRSDSKSAIVSVLFRCGSRALAAEAPQSAAYSCVRAIQASRWDLTDATVESYLSRSFDFVVDYLRRGRESMPAALDPIGDFNLQLAKKVRRLAMREGAINNPQVLVDMADDFFPLPNPDFGYWRIARAS